MLTSAAAARSRKPDSGKKATVEMEASVPATESTRATSVTPTQRMFMKTADPVASYPLKQGIQHELKPAAYKAPHLRASSASWSAESVHDQDEDREDIRGEIPSNTTLDLETRNIDVKTSSAATTVHHTYLYDAGKGSRRFVSLPHVGAHGLHHASTVARLWERWFLEWIGSGTCGILPNVSASTWSSAFPARERRLTLASVDEYKSISGHAASARRARSAPTLTTLPDEGRLHTGHTIAQSIVDFFVASLPPHDTEILTSAACIEVRLSLQPASSSEASMFMSSSTLLPYKADCWISVERRDQFSVGVAEDAEGASMQPTTIRASVEIV